MAEIKGYKYLCSDADCLHGAVRVAGTRISTAMIARDIAAGSTPLELSRILPGLSLESIEEALRFEAEVKDEMAH